MDKKRVLHISTIDFTINKMLLDKMIELSKYGYDIEFLSDVTNFMAKEKGYIKDINASGFKHHKLSMSRSINFIKDIKSIYKLYRFLKQNPYHIVHTHTAKAGMIGRIAAKLASQPIILHTSHGLPFYQGQRKLKYMLFRWMEKFASYFSDGYFSQNYEDLNVIKKLVPSHVYTGYEGNGIPLEKLDRSYEHRTLNENEFKKEYNIKPEDKLFLMAARFEPVKNHEMLIESLVYVQNTNYKIMFAGNGPFIEDIKTLAKERRVESNLIFLNYRNDIPELIKIADGILLTSEKEGIPRILMEAMALSKPVLATNVLGTKELVENGKTGELVELNDIKTLAKKIEKWATDSYSSTLVKYGLQGRERVEKHFTEAIVANRIHKLYKELRERKQK